MFTVVISKEDKILIVSLKGYGTRKLLKQFLQKKLDERRFREFDYVLILFLTVSCYSYSIQIFTMTNQSSLLKLRGIICSHALVFEID